MYCDTYIRSRKQNIKEIWRQQRRHTENENKENMRRKRTKERKRKKRNDVTKEKK
jgi:hypothetical protein